MPREQNCLAREGRMVLPGSGLQTFRMLNWRCGVLGLGFAWTLENLVVSLSREERKGQKIKQVKLISG